LVLPGFAVAVDRSYHGGIVAYSAVAVSISKQDSIVRYSDFFKHMRKLGSYRKIYLPKMLKTINQLVDSAVIAGLRVATSLDELVSLIASRSKTITVCVVDDTVASSYTARGARVAEVLKPLHLTLESSLRNPTSGLKKALHMLGVKLVFLRTLQAISDNIANYARRLFEENATRIPQVWKL
jgi:hypothetical protein